MLFRFLTITIIGLFFSIGLCAEKIIRYQTSKGKVHFGLVKNEKVYRIKNDFSEFISGNFDTVNKGIPLEGVTLLAPVEPSKVINFGWTFTEHAEEVGGETNRQDPLVFLKPPTAITAHNTAILYPEDLSNEVEFEAELALIIGKEGKNVSEENAMDYVLGFTCFNDVSARNLIRNDPQFTRGKGFDTFGPLGPWIVTDIDYRNLQIQAILNGEIKQNSNVNEMTYEIPFLISYISRVMTLKPGDIIACGTPGGSEGMVPGDTIQVKIDKIGTLTNTIQ